MKLTLWLQFSSNHSADFTVVGQFETPARAQAVFEELRAILTAIEQARAAGLSFAEVEQQYRDRYGLQNVWQLPLDDNAATPSMLRVVDTLLVASVEFDTRQEREPFLSLFKYFGGVAAGYDAEIEDKFRIELDFTAPDDRTAEILHNAISAYFQGPLGWNGVKNNPPPWHEVEANFAYVKQNPGSLLSTNQLDAIILHYTVSYAPQYDANLMRRKDWTRWASLRSTDSPPSVQRAGRRLSINNLLSDRIEFGLAAIIAYLERHQCSEIAYRLVITERDISRQSNE